MISHSSSNSAGDQNQVSETSPYIQEPILTEILSLLDRAVRGFAKSPCTIQTRGQTRTRFCPEGVVVIIEDREGIARAVAADLQALGHPVVRVRHGVGGGDIQGVNLLSRTSVAAMIERASGLGPLAAVVHTVIPRYAPDESDPPSPWTDETSVLQNLLAASVDALAKTASLGGACFLWVQANPESFEPTFATNRSMESARRLYPGVRIHNIRLDPRAEVEVKAAIVVRSILATDSRRSGKAIIRAIDQDWARTERSLTPEAILLGAPDRQSWLEVANSLIAFLKRTPNIRLIDLAATLHWGQPDYPFRVGLVATCSNDLAEKLGRFLAMIGHPGCVAVHDCTGLYWSDPAQRGQPRSRHVLQDFQNPIHQRLEISTREAPHFPDASEPTVPFPSAGEWLQHEVASRFGHGVQVDLHLFPLDHQAKVINLNASPDQPSTDSLRESPRHQRRFHLHRAIKLMDQLLDREREFAMELLRA